MYAVEMRNITMAFGDFKANDDITLKVKKNSIHALIGENGAGKSTLMSVLFGLYNQTSGQILINEKIVDINSPLKANLYGIGMVHQHFKLVEDFTVLENIVLNVEDKVAGVFVSYSKARQQINEIMNKYGFNIDLNKKIYNCSVAEQQRVEILKMLYRDSDILIFDEPTAVLSPKQIDNFLDALLDLKSKGKTIIIITHKLDELKKVADTGTVIRLGKFIADIDIKKTTHKQLSKLMIGSDLSDVKNTYKENKNESIFKVENLVVNKRGFKEIVGLNNLSFEIKAGEILGIAGVEGNGQSELVNAITGLAKIKSGQVKLRFDESKNIHEIIQNFRIYLKNIKKQSKISKHNEENIKNKIKLIEQDLKKHEKVDISAISERELSTTIKNDIENFRNLYPSNDLNLFIEKFDEIKENIIKINRNIEIFIDITKYSNEFINFKNYKKVAKITKKLKCETIDEKSYWIDITKASIANKYLVGMSNIPEDRHLHGLFLDANLIENSISQVIGNYPYSVANIINQKEIKNLSKVIVNNFDVRSSNGIESVARSLSGGNQQKFIVGRELSKYSKFIIIAQPTRGLDVGAINLIHDYILKAKAANKAILLVSYEIDEIISLSDRVIVLNGGQQTGVLENEQINKENLGVLMARKAVKNEENK